MAGIGFTLRNMVRRDDLLGVVMAHLHSSFVSTGPWIFTIIAIAGISIMSGSVVPYESFINFHVILIYNFAFSLIIGSGFAMLATRYLSDNIYVKNVTSGPAMLVGLLSLQMLVQLPLVLWFYLSYVEMSLSLRLVAILSYFIISPLWLLCVFLTTLKDYTAVSRTFLIGMAIAFFSAYWLGGMYGEVALLLGFSIGVAVIVFMLIGEILAEYNYNMVSISNFWSYFRRYWDIALGGSLYALAIWIDKIVMTLAAPETQLLPTGMIIYLDYIQAMFLAYIVIIPSIAVFLISVETGFFEQYDRFYRDILGHMPLRRIKKNHERVIESILSGARNITIIQGLLCFLCIVLAHKIFEVLGISFMQISMFRFGILGGFFHALALFGIIILQYFDSRPAAFWSLFFFAATNGIFTWISIGFGVSYYGYGYFLSSFLTFLLVGWQLFRYVNRLPYHAFITNNVLVKKA